jgi:HrpA-like RNA helicase
MTDGTLVKLLQSKETLLNKLTKPDAKIITPQWDVIVVDEAHERSLDTDILFAVLRRIQKSTGVKVVIMSATLDIEKVSRYFGEAPVFSVPGKMWQVDIYYQSLEV